MEVASPQRRDVCAGFDAVQIVKTYKQSRYKQSGWAEPASLSNGQGWAGAAEATGAKQSRLGSGRARMRKQAISLPAAGGRKIKTNPP